MSKLLLLVVSMVLAALCASPATAFPAVTTHLTSLATCDRPPVSPDVDLSAPAPHARTASTRPTKVNPVREAARRAEPWRAPEAIIPCRTPVPGRVPHLVPRPLLN
jgi:hypothetical protein